jgi:predicted DsbA family dithiol-disulfide isomerase
MMTAPLTVEIYYDYLCPFAYQGTIWLNRVKEKLGDQVNFVWKAFSLEQVNSAHGPEWTVWGQPASVQSFSRNQFAAAYAAEKQGPGAFNAFHTALFDLHHQDRKIPGKLDTLVDAATRAGLDVEAFTRDLSDPALWARIGEDYNEGLRKGVFGTPTLVFPNGTPLYVKMYPAPPEEDTLKLWDQVVAVSEQPYLAELKKGNPPLHHQDGKH